MVQLFGHADGRRTRSSRRDTAPSASGSTARWIPRRHRAGTDMWVSFDADDVLAGWPDERTTNGGGAVRGPEYVAERPAERVHQRHGHPPPRLRRLLPVPGELRRRCGGARRAIRPEARGRERWRATGSSAPMEPSRACSERPAEAATQRWSRMSATASSRYSPTRRTKRPATSPHPRIVEGNGNQAQGGNLHTLNNPSPVGGRGGTCSGDSGGPVFINRHERCHRGGVLTASAAPATAPTTHGGSTQSTATHSSLPTSTASSPRRLADQPSI